MIEVSKINNFQERVVSKLVILNQMSNIEKETSIKLSDYRRFELRIHNNLILIIYTIYFIIKYFLANYSQGIRKKCSLRKIGG